MRRARPILTSRDQLSLLPAPLQPRLLPPIAREDVLAALADLLVEALGEPAEARHAGGHDESQDHA